MLIKYNIYSLNYRLMNDRQMSNY